MATYNEILRDIERIKKNKGDFKRLKALRAQKKYYRSTIVYHYTAIDNFKNGVLCRIPDVESIIFPYINLKGGFRILMNKEWFFLFKNESIIVKYIRSEALFNKKRFERHYVYNVSFVEDLDWGFCFLCSLLKYNKGYSYYKNVYLTVSKNGKFFAFNSRSKRRALSSLEKKILENS